MRKNPFKFAVLISGRGSNLRSLIAGVGSAKIAGKLCVVLSDKPHASGLTIARDHSVPTVVVQRRAKEQSAAAYDQQLVTALSAYQPDLIVLAGFMRVLGAHFIRAFSGRIINIHPSLLPAFRGLDAHAQAIAAGVRIAGCTVHYVEEEVDAGPIIAQGAVSVLPDDTSETLAARILNVEHHLLPAVVAGIARGEIALINEQGKKVVHFKGEQSLQIRTDMILSYPALQKEVIV